MVKRTAKRKTVAKKSTASKHINGYNTLPNTRIAHVPVQALPAYKCKYCGYVSQPRTLKPKVCPHCHRFHWIS